MHMETLCLSLSLSLSFPVLICKCDGCGRNVMPKVVIAIWAAETALTQFHFQISASFSSEHKERRLSWVALFYLRRAAVKKHSSFCDCHSNKLFFIFIEVCVCVCVGGGGSWKHLIDQLCHFIAEQPFVCPVPDRSWILFSCVFKCVIALNFC